MVVNGVKSFPKWLFDVLVTIAPELSRILATYVFLMCAIPIQRSCVGLIAMMTITIIPRTTIVVVVVVEVAAAAVVVVMAIVTARAILIIAIVIVMMTIIIITIIVMITILLAIQTYHF
jgi:hypothetical protein